MSSQLSSYLECVANLSKPTTQTKSETKFHQMQARLALVANGTENVKIFLNVDSAPMHRRRLRKRNQNPDLEFVKLLRSFVFISLIIPSMILHVTIVTPRRC